MKNIIEESKIAYESYILNTTYEIQDKILKYIQTRIDENKKEIEDLINLTKENIQFEEIKNIFNTSILNDYKKYDDMIIDNNFLYAKVMMPVGVICIQCEKISDVIKCYSKAIKSRNSVVIADKNYNKLSIKNLILVIVKEAIKKFNVNENLITIMPYDKCIFGYFDTIIFENGEFSIKKKITNNKYIYVEDEELKEEALKNANAKFIYGDIDNAINTINNEYAEVAVIYTKDANVAYKFINLVRSKNVFVNTNIQNSKDIDESKNGLYMYENIIIPIPETNIPEETVNQKVSEGNTIKQDKSLTTIPKENVLEKIKNILKSLFKR